MPLAVLTGDRITEVAVRWGLIIVVSLQERIILDYSVLMTMAIVMMVLIISLSEVIISNRKKGCKLGN